MGWTGMELLAVAGPLLSGNKAISPAFILPTPLRCNERLDGVEQSWECCADSPTHSLSQWGRLAAAVPVPAPSPITAAHWTSPTHCFCLFLTWTVQVMNSSQGPYHNARTSCNDILFIPHFHQCLWILIIPPYSKDFTAINKSTCLHVLGMLYTVNQPLLRKSWVLQLTSASLNRIKENHRREPFLTRLQNVHIKQW